MDEITNWFVLCFDASELAFWEKSRNDQIKMRGGMLRPQLYWPRDQSANLWSLWRNVYSSASWWALTSDYHCLKSVTNRVVWLWLWLYGHMVCISFLTDSQPLSSWAVFPENSASSIQIINRGGGKYFFTALEIRGDPVKSVWLNSSSPRTWHEL